MSNVRLKYTGLVSPAELGWQPTDGTARPLIQTGDVVEVDAQLAGEAPHWRPLADDEPQYPWREHRTAADGAVEVHDLGSGLLAQTDNWVKAGGHPKAATTTNDEKKGA